MQWFDTLRKNSRWGAAALAVLLLAVLLWPVLAPSDEPSDLVRFIGRFHPLVVHLPIGFLLLAGVLEALGRVRGFAYLRPVAPFVLLLGVCSAVLAVLAGLYLAQGGGYDGDTLTWHKRLGIALAVVSGLAYGMHLLARRGRWAPAQQAYVVLLAGTVGLLAVASHFGGTLTHGGDYLTRYMPDPMRLALTLPPKGADTHRQIENPEEARVFEALIQPILEESCVECHNPSKKKGRLLLDTPEGIREGGEDGPVLVAGRAEESEIVHRLLLPVEHEDHMPPEGKRPLAASQVELIRWWIDQGASFDLTLADAEPAPSVEPILAFYMAADSKTGVFALDLPPADPDAVDAARETGVAVMPLAQDVTLLQVHTTNAGSSFGDAELAALRPLARQITWLDLSGTQVTDNGLRLLAGMPHLTRLHLNRTAIGDAGLAHLRNLEYLEYLNLYGTQVTDDGLEHLVALPKLKALYLWQTAVTPSGAEGLQAQRPRLEVNLGWQGPPVVTAADSSGTAE